MAVAVAVAVAVSEGGAVAVAVACLTKRFFNHIQKDFLINVGSYVEFQGFRVCVWQASQLELEVASVGVHFVLPFRPDVVLRTCVQHVYQISWHVFGRK